MDKTRFEAKLKRFEQSKSWNRITMHFPDDKTEIFIDSIGNRYLVEKIDSFKKTKGKPVESRTVDVSNKRICYTITSYVEWSTWEISKINVD